MLSVPLATWTAEVERVVLPPHPPLVPPVTLTQDTVTALEGTVAQEVKVAGALTFRFHDPNTETVAVHVTTELADPLTTGLLVGLVAVNEMDAGVTAGLTIIVRRFG